MSRIYIPTKSANDWTQLLVDPAKHWRTGYSARTLAHSWQNADGFPAEIQAAFSTNEDLAGIQLLLAFPEHQVPLIGDSRPSQNDCALLSAELLDIAIWQSYWLRKCDYFHCASLSMRAK